MQTLRDKFIKTVEQFNMFLPGESVAVGFSGGADSVCLLSLLNEYKDDFGISLTAAHVNHLLRGEESDADEQFVREFCRQNGIPLKVLRADIGELSAQTKQSLELCGREVRYRFFESLNTDKTATAHTGSDVVETMLMNLSRGASLRGLCSIPPVRDKIVRPLIRFTREETEAYCKMQGLRFVTDSTNSNNDCTRNRYRHTVIPVLKELNPSFETAALRCAENLRAENDYISLQAGELFQRCFQNGRLAVMELGGAHPALINRVIALFLNALGITEAETKHILYLCEHLTENGRLLTLPGGRDIQSDGTALFAADNLKPADADEMLRLRKNALNEIRFNGHTLRFDVAQNPNVDADEYKAGRAVDFFKIDDIIEIRSPRPGDKIRIAERKCSKSLKKLYTEKHINAYRRRALPVIADSRGVIWAYGAGADESRLPDKNTKRFLIIDTEDDKNE